MNTTKELTKARHIDESHFAGEGSLGFSIGEGSISDGLFEENRPRFDTRLLEDVFEGNFDIHTLEMGTF